MNREKWIAVWVGIGVIVFFLFAPRIFGIFESSRQSTGIMDTQNNLNEDMNQERELLINDVVVGEGEEAVPGSMVVVHYTGTFEDGQKFDSSLDRNEPFQFILGQGQVIPGWDIGVAGMKVGGKRILTIPPSLAYGEEGVLGAIPPNSTLTFEVELLNVIKSQ